MDDMRKVTEPKSDQWNFDDFQSGPLTFTIEAVRVKGGQEQPVEITLAGTPKFYRPCKSMCRVMVSAWGADSSKYVGRSLTLYGDQKIKWGGMEVGGIRISHMSDIDTSMTMALTVTRANKKPYTVKPIIKSAAAQVPAQTHSVAQSQEPHPEPAPAADPTDEQLIEMITAHVKKKEFTEAYDLARTGIKDDTLRTDTVARIKKAEAHVLAKAAA
jgi:hypothetical protein